MEKIIYNLDNIQIVADKLIKILPNYKYILFHGEMGSGKTTLIRELLKKFNCEYDVKSPTFSILNIYDCPNNKKIFHIDLYRINSVEELQQAGIIDNIYNESPIATMVEWPDLLYNFLNDNYLDIYIQIIDRETRELLIDN